MHDADSRFERALAKIDAANDEDPNTDLSGGVERPKERVYAERMSVWLARLAPDASEVLRLAARAQHIRRWTIPRTDYPDGRRGYLDWRNACKQMHADVAGEILAEVGYDAPTIGRVQDLLLKKKLKINPEMQALEDVICLVFLESYFADFSAKHEEEKLVNIVRKTWKKMSPHGHEAALTLDLPDALAALVAKALAE